MTLLSEAIERDRAATLAKLKDIVGPSHWTEDPATLAPYLSERRGLFQGRTPLLLLPGSTEEVAAIVEICAEAGLPIVPQGGNTGLVGAGIPYEQGREIMVQLGRLNRIRGIDADNYTMTVEAGCILADVQAAAAEVDRLFPLSYGSEGSAMIGGAISTNAGGTAVLRYGNTRELVLGLEVVLPDGRIWEGLQALRKDNTGYDLKHLFIGAEGTLGIVTAAVLKLFPRPRDIQTALVALGSYPDVIALFARAREISGDLITSFELIPRIGMEFALRHMPHVRDPFTQPYHCYALIEFSGGAAAAVEADAESHAEMGSTPLRAALEDFLADGIENGLIQDAVVARSAAQAAGLWRIREALVEAQKAEGGSIKHDVSVPVSRIAELIERGSERVIEAMPGIRPVPFGHVGDGNIHFNLSQPEGMDKQEFLAEWERFNRLIHDLVVALGGSISAEHGIGRLKREELRRYKSPVEISLMRTLKKTFDPKGIMNPGKVVPE